MNFTGGCTFNQFAGELWNSRLHQYLIANGIDPSRIQSAKGYGEDRLLNDCDGSVRCTSQQHQLNRRSEFIVVDM